ncbi:MAG: protein phosphatase CheZ [Proteobacteria bacterium]|nr:protein phosphatase CheZ [Pseudomonadota bacterium]
MKFYNVFKNLADRLPDNQNKETLQDIVIELKSFLQQIGEADKSHIDRVLEDFESRPENPLFREIGKLLRKFHDQQVKIRGDIPENLGKFANQEVAEMSGKLQMIISMMDKAANTTLDKAEEAIGELSQQGDSYVTRKLERTVSVFLGNAVQARRSALGRGLE